MTLYNIHTLGIQCHCSDLIIDPNDMETIYFMSVCGYQVAVKGLVANFLEKSGISININGEDHDLVRSDMDYTVQMKKLPSAIRRDWRKASSIIGLRTRASTRGAPSYSNFFIT